MKFNNAQTLIAAQEYWKKNPLACAYSLFVDKLTPQQEALVDAVFSNNTTFVLSAHGLGKSYGSALVLLLFMYIYFPDAQVVSFAPTWGQVEDILWAEIGKIWENSKATKSGLKLGGELLKTKLELSRDCFAVGMSPKLDNEDEGQRITGRHALNQLIILDEAHGVDSRVWKFIKALRTGANCRMLAIGNAAKTSGDFYVGCNNHKNKKLFMNIFDSPNFKDNGISDISKLREIYNLPNAELENTLENLKVPFPGLSSVRWALDCMDDWGEVSPLFQSRVLARFVSMSDDGLIKLADLDECTRTEKTAPSIKALGVDPSRINDRTVLFGLHNYQECFRKILPGQDLMKLRDIITGIALQGEYAVISIDICGLGIGLYDALLEAKRGNDKIPRIIPVNFGAAPTSKYEKICNNLVTELWFRASKLIEKQEVFLKDKDTLFAELSNRKYETDNKGKIVIEQKKKYKKRFGGESPDIADAFLYALAGIFWGTKKIAGVKAFGERVAGKLDI